MIKQIKKRETSDKECDKLALRDSFLNENLLVL